MSSSCLDESSHGWVPARTPTLHCCPTVGRPWVARSGDQPVSRSSTHGMQKLFNKKKEFLKRKTGFVVTDAKKTTKTETIPRFFCNQRLDDIRNVTLAQETSPQQQKTRYWGSHDFCLQQVTHSVGSKKDSGTLQSKNGKNQF